MIAATFISNSQHYSYPVELWKQGLKNFETKIFETRKVLKPCDIGDIQNECLTELFKTHDIVYWLQADLIFNPDKTQELHNLIDIHKFNFGLLIRKCMMYMDYGLNYFGSLVIRKENFNISKFTGDGAYCGSGCVDMGGCFGIDVGYLGHNNFKNHMAQQTQIWPPGKSQMPVYDLKNLIDPCVFKMGLDYFNLHTEFNTFSDEFNRSGWSDPMKKKWVGKNY